VFRRFLAYSGDVATFLLEGRGKKADNLTVLTSRKPYPLTMYLTGCYHNHTGLRAIRYTWRASYLSVSAVLGDLQMHGSAVESLKWQVKMPSLSLALEL
jgi:hypothetical protein